MKGKRLNTRLFTVWRVGEGQKAQYQPNIQRDQTKRIRSPKSWPQKKTIFEQSFFHPQSPVPPSQNQKNKG